MHPPVVSYLSAIKLPLKMSRQKYIFAVEWGGIPTGCQTAVLILLVAAKSSVPLYLVQPEGTWRDPFCINGDRSERTPGARDRDRGAPCCVHVLNL